MDQETKNLYVFGYGISLLIPFLMYFRMMHLSFGHSNFFVLIASFVLLLFVITKISVLRPVFNLWILCVHFIVADLKISTGYSMKSLVFWAVAVLVLFVTVRKVGLLRPVYLKWMKVAHFIGLVISSTVLSVIYYIVFAPVGIFLRIAQKDLMDRKIEKDKVSYWLDREKEEFDQDRYKQQF